MCIRDSYCTSCKPPIYTNHQRNTIGTYADDTNIFSMNEDLFNEDPTVASFKLQIYLNLIGEWLRTENQEQRLHVITNYIHLAERQLSHSSSQPRRNIRTNSSHIPRPSFRRQTDLKHQIKPKRKQLTLRFHNQNDHCCTPLYKNYPD